MLLPALLVARLLSCLVALVLLVTPARADVASLRVDLKRDGAVTAGAFAFAAALSSSIAAPGHCRFCGSGRLDDAARDRLVWSDPGSARLASDILANGVLPAAALLNSALSAHAGGEPSAFWEDALVLAEVVALNCDLNLATKDATARRRPSAGLQATGSANRSFFSGHTSVAFSIATAAGTLSTLRGYPSAPWVWAGGMALASGVGYLRVAGDAHWASDVITGAAVGGLVGFTVPWFFHRLAGAGAGGRVEVVPSPGGFGVIF
jgi:membrane-associated phospholipid phosphatase